MQRQNKALKIIGNNSGASVLFVLAVMLLLMAIGVSALVAASASAGSGINKQVNNQLIIYADSMQKSIMHSLKANDGDEGKAVDALSPGGLDTLGGQILRVAYNAYNDALAYGTDPGDELTLNITPTLSNGSDAADISNIDVTLKLKPSVSVTETPYKPADVNEDGDIVTEEEQEQKTAAVSATVTVTVTVAHRTKSIISVATYDFSGGLLESDEYDPTVIVIADAGEWRLISYDKADK